MFEMHSWNTHMLAVNLNTFDLNLLIVFDAVMRERSVTRAGGRIGLSQPAVSHALNRLRYLLDDELFVRTPTGMAPTPRAEALSTPIRDVLIELRRALEPAAFDPAVSERAFSLALNNYAAVLVAPPLVAAVSGVAPSVRLELLPSGTLDLVDHLDRGNLDLALAALEPPGERFATAPLLEDELVVVMREGHPAVQDGLSAEAFAALDQLEISSSLDNTSFVDRWLAEQGLTRRIALRAPFISSAQILVQSDLIANMSGRVARHLAHHHALQICRPPYRSPAAQLTMLWHRRFDSDPAHQWLRGVIRSIAERL
jgi:DNA-binding transcriptional LysR family regulator